MPAALIRRRALLASLCALPLTACQSGETAAIRYRVIASAFIEGKRVEGSTVMEIRYSRVKNSLIGAGGAARLYGEALILDLNGRGTVYVLPIQRQQGPLRQIYEPGILTTLGISGGIGSLREADFELLRHAKGRMPFQHYGRLPAVVAFGDEANPKTIHEINPHRIGEYFRDVRFGGLEIEITDAPLTEKLLGRLEWLDTPLMQQVFDRDPPGHLRPTKDRPIGFLINKDHFFGDGNR